MMPLFLLYFFHQIFRHLIFCFFREEVLLHVTVSADCKLRPRPKHQTFHETNSNLGGCKLS